MSCCGGNCGCGANCGCGSDCKGCKMHTDIGYSKSTASETLIVGVAPIVKPHLEGSEKGGEGGNGCKCSPCKCNPCNC